MTKAKFLKATPKAGLIILAYIAFISLGLPDGLLGVAWPSIREHFTLPLDALGAMLFAGMLGYLTSSFLSGQLMSRLGVGRLLAASCALTGLGLLGYTLVPAWGMMVALAVVAGFGAGAIDAGLNTYVADNFSEGSMQWLHASYGIGVTLGPIIMTGALNLFGAWQLGYRVVSAAQIILAASFLLTVSLWQSTPAPGNSAARSLTDYKTPLWQTLRQPAVWLSLAMFFLYTGSEATLGTWAYTLLTEARGVASEVAGLVAGSYWAMFTVGRVLAGLYTRKVSGLTLLRACMVSALAGVLLLWWNPSQWVSLAGIAITGFAIAPIFPGLVSGTHTRVGALHTANTIGMQIGAAGLSAALVPGLAGVLARRFSLEVIPPYLGGLFLMLFALYLLSSRKPIPRATTGETL
jgi:fucose permease